MSHLKIFVIIAFLSGYDCCKGYYWRDYNGKIPDDALIAGKDLKGNNVYIGHALIIDKGTVVCRIIPGEKEVTAPWGGINRVDKNIMILCGSPENFEWIKTSTATLSSDLAGHEPVIGGFDGAILNIGRLFYKGETKIAKVILSGHIYFDDGGEERFYSNKYELLTYKDGGLDTVVDHLFGG